MKRRFRLDIEYDGTAYAGWQRQKNNLTVQEVIEDALSAFNMGKRVPVTGSGRTDAGVHARRQVAHFDLDTEYAPEVLFRALQAKTGRAIRILSCQVAAGDFHARFQAVKRTYMYQIAENQTVFDRNYSWHPDVEYNLKMLDRCAALLPGEHNFSKLSRQSSETENKVCFIYESEWKKSDNFLIYCIAGNRFLHSMVRMLVGTMITVAAGRGSLGDFSLLVENKPSGLQVFTAPPQGLFLSNVEYDS